MTTELDLPLLGESGTNSDRPTVSVVLPCLNERRYIRDCIDSLLAQDYPEILEILICDGGSTDGTRDIVERIGGPIRLIDNPGVTAAAGLNRGLRASVGDILVRGDAHSLYLPDYVSRCVQVLLETEATNVGGPMRAVGRSSFGRSVAAVTSSPFGVGPGRFHDGTERSEVDTVYLGCWWRSTLDELGGWDEDSLQWAAEDQELNLRITRAGGRIIMDPSIRSWYFPRETPGGLARQYFNYGVCKASTLKKHGMLPSWRPLAPAGLVLLAAGGLIGARGARRIAVPTAHALACAVVALSLGREDGVAPHRALLVIETCHWSYGLGFWRGVLRVLSRTSFQNRPSGHR